MPSDESALLAAVAVDLGDDLPRLVYADWLDDHGEAIRAEFIRLQCQIARLADVPQWQRERSVHLWMRQQELLDHHRAELVGDLADLPENPVDVVWERGFLAELTLDAEHFLRLADRLDARVPTPRVTVEQAAGPLDRFIVCPHLGCLTGVRFDMPGLPDDLPPLGEQMAGIAVALGQLPRLDTLDLSRCWLYDDDLPDLFPAGGYPALRTLDLSLNGLTDAGVVFLLNAGLPQRLTRLVLDRNPLTDSSAFELADRLGRVPTFRTLDIRSTAIGQPGHSALTSAFGSRCNLF